MNKTILGIQSYANHDAGASIIQFDEKSNEYIAISEERLSRKKYEYEFPLLSIDYCLKYFGIKKLSDVDLIVSDWIRIKRWLRSGPSYNYQLFDYYKEYLNFPKNKIIQIDHHLAHAASCYYTSSFKDSAILVVDGNGSDVQTNSFFEGNDNQIKRVDMYKNHGIGSAYAAVSREILGFGTGGEGKTMGLAPYGKYNKNIKINVKLDGVKTDLSKFMLRLPKSDVLNQINDNYRSSLIRKKSGRANKKNILNKKFRDWAFMIQNLYLISKMKFQPIFDMVLILFSIFLIHISAVFCILPFFCKYIFNKNNYNLIFIVIILIILFSIIFIEQIYFYIQYYIYKDVIYSVGAIPRIILCVIPSIIFFFNFKFFKEKDNFTIWFFSALISIIFFLLIMIKSTNPALDRFAFFLIPFQAYVYKELLENIKNKHILVFVKISLVVFYILIFIFWLKFAIHSKYWLPYMINFFLY